jgi:hypothetical protein
LFAKNLNYYNSSEKIKSFWKVTFWENNRKTEQDVRDNLKNDIWGACESLAKYLYEIIRDEKLCEKFEKETGKPCSIHMCSWNSREYFCKEDATHIFVTLNIGNKTYILDQSFGEMSLEKESGYIIKESWTSPSVFLNYANNHIWSLVVDFD